jgi:hypothetical protein
VEPPPASRSAPPRPAHGSHRAAASAAAEEAVAAVGFESRHARAGRHRERFQNLARARIDPPHVALVTVRAAVPQLAVDPGDAGDEALRLDRAKDRPRLGIDLMDLAVAILPDPEGAFGPGESRIAAHARRRDGGEHAAGLRIDLLDAVLGKLEQVPAVEGRSRMRGDSE